MIEAGVAIGIIPESAARRHSRTMQLALVALDETWAVRERSILVRELDALPGSVRALIATLVPMQFCNPGPPNICPSALPKPVDRTRVVTVKGMSVHVVSGGDR